MKGGIQLAEVKENHGMYALACETSPYRNEIDMWLNQNKGPKWISEQLRSFGDEYYISPASITKYSKKRDEIIQKEIEETPMFQAKQQMVTEEFNKSVAKIQKVDLIGRLSELIEDSAELLEDAKFRGIQINSVKDMRMVQQTMLDAINAYGETMLNAQKFAEIQNDPSLLQHKSTTINIDVKMALADILKGAVEDGGDGYSIIDRLRNGISKQ